MPTVPSRNSSAPQPYRSSDALSSASPFLSSQSRSSGDSTNSHDSSAPPAIRLHTMSPTGVALSDNEDEDDSFRIDDSEENLTLLSRSLAGLSASKAALPDATAATAAAASAGRRNRSFSRRGSTSTASHGWSHASHGSQGSRGSLGSLSSLASLGAANPFAAPPAASTGRLLSRWKLPWLRRSQHKHIRLPDAETEYSDGPGGSATPPNSEGNRLVLPGAAPVTKYASNAISNAKYSPLTFIPVILYHQFKFFFNLYFLLVALSQAIPQLRIGYLSSYIVPLAFVLTVTMGKEAADDIQRRRRDAEANNEQFEVLGSSRPVASKDLCVGDLVKLHKDHRVPADMVLLWSSEPGGETFIRTDQLDGETDWKLRIAPKLSQEQPTDSLFEAQITAAAPDKHIHTFVGTLALHGHSVGLSVDNTLWANTVLAAGSAVGCVVYTGPDTRQAKNTAKAGTKVGKLELEVNNISKILCACVFLLSAALVAAHGFRGEWYVDLMRFLILFSTIIPVSLRVNLDLGKSVYAHQIEHDTSIPETIVRTSTIPEDLGRVEYLLTDKTGTLTQNDMEMKKLHLGTASFGTDAMDLVAEAVAEGYGDIFNHSGPANGTLGTKKSSQTAPGSRPRRDLSGKIRDAVLTLALCHTVTPSHEDGTTTYQASSPDEVAIVQWTAAMGLRLVRRDRSSITLEHTASGGHAVYSIREVFPFTSDSKRMGIIVQDPLGELWFLQKGADTVMARIVQRSEWLDEETANMAREGLRTLVVGRKRLSPEVYEQFRTAHSAAALAMTGREEAMAAAVAQHLETDLELLALTGVEDKLQTDVKPSLELLRNAGVKIWMLTGDKVETARCIAVSSKLVARGQAVHAVTRVTRRDAAAAELDQLRTRRDACLLIDGESLAVFLTHFRSEFFAVAVALPAVVACRCSPQQKADVAQLIRGATRKRVCCIGDGGNDVSMIQAADVGIGIVGKEGRQASLAADFSVTQFCHVTPLLLWHGRNSYKRSAKLAQFIIHRGVLISVCQALYSVCSAFEPLALYQGWLMVGYATVYTMAPVFSLVLDEDVPRQLALLYPELYKELRTGRALSYRSFFVWVLVSLWQGCVVQGLAQVFVGLDQDQFARMVAVSFSALILNELLMVAAEIHTWARAMVLSELVTLGVYIASVPFLGDYFDLPYIASGRFVVQVAVILVASLLPVVLAKWVHRRLNPPNYAKVQQG